MHTCYFSFELKGTQYLDWNITRLHPPNSCGVRGWRRVTFQTAQYPFVICWSVTEAFVAVRVWFSLCCTGLFGWFGAALKTFFLFKCFRETLVVSKVLGGFFFSSETVSYSLMGPIESSRSVNSYPGSTCFATLLQNEMNSDVVRFTTHIKPVLQQIRLLIGLNMRGKTRNIAIQRVLQQYQQ